MEAAIIMISRSGHILEILICIYQNFWLKYVKSASYQHNTTDDNEVRYIKLSEI